MTSAARLALVSAAILAPVSLLAAGMESIGNVDGVVTWNLGDIPAGESRSRTAIVAWDADLGALVSRLQRARGEADLSADGKPATKQAGDVVWISSGVTDFALNDAGSFYWEGRSQALACPAGGQLSRFGYFAHYTAGEPRRAGTIISAGNRAEDNLRVAAPAEALSETRLRCRTESADGLLAITIDAAAGPESLVRVRFTLANRSDRKLDDVKLTVYANLESAHTHDGDYSTLDRRTGGLLVVDPASRLCAVLTGLEVPDSGWSGTWASQEALHTPIGLPRESWGSFEGIPAGLAERLAREGIPHPVAPFVANPAEPETRTLTAEESRDALERDWLFQAEGVPFRDRALAEIGWARALATRISAMHGCPDLSVPLARLAQLERQAGAVADANGPDARSLYLEVRRAKREIAFANPVLDFESVLFIDQPYPQGAEWPHEARHRNGMMAMPGGRLLVLTGLHPGGALRKLAPTVPGAFWRPDLSFDATRVLFCYKPHDGPAFHLYEIGVDGSGLRRLTDGPYDDLDPIYLPDGHIIFTSTRCNTYVRCMPYTYSYVLARCEADGSDIYLISQGNEPDWCPSLLHDGRVIYSRWEYTDKALWRIQSLWATNQDGTGTAAFWGNQSVWPDHLAEPRAIPGSPRVMFTGLAHHNWFAGSIGIIDPRKGFNFPDGLTKVTRDMPWPECGAPPVDPGESADYHASGPYAAYKSPYPLSEEDFLVSASRPDGKFRLYLMDVHGNRELIYEGAHNIWYAMPVKPRQAPPMHTDRVNWPGTGPNRRPADPGILFSSDVLQGVPDLPRSLVRYLRVIQMDSKTCSTWTRDSRFSGPGVSILQDDGPKRILGTVPIQPDGSVHFRAPAGKALHFQLLDADFRALHTMRSFTGVLPGEVRGCLGCHEMHSVAPPVDRGLAMQSPPCEIKAPPWGPTTINYERLVQPVLDRYCGACHQRDGKARGKLDLTLRPGFQFYKEPYPTLVGWANYSGAPNSGMPGIAGALMCENYEQSDPASYATIRPMTSLSYTSRLIRIARGEDPGHPDLKVDTESLRRLVAWVDANCPYRGEEDLRAIPDSTLTWLPVPPQCANAPDIPRP